ncbi:disintegrin and metalloproteinase domain-containing protein 20-like [Ochotona princeps]|uniref:disintegrin and metalloproteinase domain-containing protein 20-like n=1 Tax=Ochotona princeps TaxID=9978 RepID=UPI0027155036|nr:disintegrin and metalloproteinase domain-containing protein 20-like [Ochotona princeps]
MAVPGTPRPIRITLVLLWFEVSLFIPDLSQARSSQQFSSVEVVIPLRVTSKSRGAGSPGWLSYSLRFGGQRHVVHMRVKRLLISTHLPVFTYSEQHALQEDHPFVPEDCFYHGFVEGDPESLVALSTCYGGFRGMLQINNLMYEIEPIEYSTTFEHLVSQLDSDDTQSPHMRCGLTEELIAQQLALQASYNFTVEPRSRLNWWTHWRYIELAVVVDHGRYVYSQSNESRVQYDVFHVINAVDEYFKHMEVDVTLMGMEIWTARNLIDTTGDLEPVLERFSSWKSPNFDRRIIHDVAHLFRKELHGIQLGVAYVGGICYVPLNCGIDIFEGNSLTLFAHTLTHELGHNLGMLHDSGPCTCGDRFCIMYPSRQNSRRFSNCSYSEYMETVISTGTCILSPARPQHITRLRFCGNGAVEEGEECDCGSLQECARDHCCMTTCSLKPGAACGHGACCKKCKLLPSGTVCREKTNECDLPEWCNGTSPECPDDVYLQDGIECGTNSYCYQKACNNHDIQCKEIFGTEASSASASCYNDMNTQGNRFGHCEIYATRYLPCLSYDVMCGRVQCQNVVTLPALKDHYTVHQSHFNNTTCWGTDYHLGMSVPDIGEVKDGTVCDKDKICLNKRCVSRIRLSVDCQRQHCNRRGVCNNKQHCHCHPGWAPPNCTVKGLGGSIDSGPPPPLPPGATIPPLEENTTPSVENPPPPDANPTSGAESPENPHMARIIFTYVLIFIVLILFYLFCCLMLCKAKQKNKDEMPEKEDENEQQADESEV